MLIAPLSLSNSFCSLHQIIEALLCSSVILQNQMQAATNHTFMKDYLTVRDEMQKMAIILALFSSYFPRLITSHQTLLINTFGFSTTALRDLLRWTIMQRVLPRRHRLPTQIRPTARRLTTKATPLCSLTNSTTTILRNACQVSENNQEWGVEMGKVKLHCLNLK